jgi:YD repeat-containing protein
MQKTLATLTLILSIALVSCDEKNPVVDPPVDPAPTDTTAANATVLAQTVLTSGANTTTQTYRYDANKRLTWFSNTSTKADYFEDTSEIVRDDNGIIKRVVYRSDTSRKYPDPNLDSVVHRMFYNATDNKYTYKLLQYRSYNTLFKDSTAFTYGAQNRIVKEETFYYDYRTTKSYQPASKTDYTYDGDGNLTVENTVFYKVDNQNDYPFQVTYTYDEKGKSLLNLGNEAIVIGIRQHFAAGLPKTKISNYPQNAAHNRSQTYTYTYNTKYRPLKADITEAVTNTQSTLTFNYQYQ